LTFDPSVDFDLIATESEGLSGADLQAVVYNAHLDVIQASIADEVDTGAAEGKGKGKGKEVEGKANGKGDIVANGHAAMSKAKEWTQIAPRGETDITAEMRSRVSQNEPLKCH